jgi:Leucine-rich repeat (LRR) protein
VDLAYTDFVACFVEKYSASHVEDSRIATSLSKGVMVETVGWEKIAKRQEDLAGIREVGLASMRISEVGDLSLVPAGLLIEDLDLSKNLIWEWSIVAKIIERLGALTSLRLNYNRFSRPVGLPVFETIRILSLNGTMTKWDSIVTLSASFTALVELHLGGNEMSDIPASGSILPYLTVLNLESNRLEWSHVVNVSNACPNLGTLYLQNNAISHIPLHESGFTALATLNISNNSISESGSLMSLSTYPFLNRIRYRGNTLEFEHGELICHLQVFSGPCLTFSPECNLD